MNRRMVFKNHRQCKLNEISRRLMNWDCTHTMRPSLSRQMLSGSNLSIGFTVFRFAMFPSLFSEFSLLSYDSFWNFQGCIAVYLSRCCCCAVLGDNCFMVSQPSHFVNNFFETYFYRYFSFARWIFIISPFFFICQCYFGYFSNIWCPLGSASFDLHSMGCYI